MHRRGFFHRDVVLFWVSFVSWCSAGVAHAQTPTGEAARAGEVAAVRTELERLRAEHAERIAILEARLRALEAEATPAPRPAPSPEPSPEPSLPPAVPVAAAETPPGAAGAGGPAGPLPVYGGGSKVFNPDIAVVGNFLGAIGRNDVEPAPSVRLNEAEASFQAIVDPYARADFFVAFGEEGAEVEEGFVTFPALPGGLLMKVGKFKGSFGKVNALHPHAWSWTDRPLVSRNLLGGEEGFADAGISVSRLVPNPWVFLEATAEVFRGESEGLFAAPERSDLAYLGRLRGYQDLGESVNLEVGGSFLRGHDDAGPGAARRVFGLDATLRWRPLRRAIYRRFLARTELMWSRRDLDAAPAGAFGFYLSGDYQFARRWYLGGRFDRSERADDPRVRDRAGSLVLTFWPSEFSQVRAQARRTRYAEGHTAHELLFQFLFSIGAHGAHVF
jgi:hypothetical protein